MVQDMLIHTDFVSIAGYWLMLDWQDVEKWAACACQILDESGMPSTLTEALVGRRFESSVVLTRQTCQPGHQP